MSVENGIILPKDEKQKNYLESMVSEYDLKQYIKKIQLNSMYGLLLNSSSVFYDFRLGASTTMSGRQVVKHLTAKANELLCGKYEAIGYCAQYNDTDSKISTTKQRVIKNGIEIEETVEELFKSCPCYHVDVYTGKEYGFTKDLVLGYNDETNEPEYLPINYVYRHKTSKEKWEIEDENGNIITVTEDHSCMVERDGKLISIKPKDINLETDILVTISDK